MTDEAAREAAYPIGKHPAVNQNAILLGRALAIQSYATLEQSLSMLFARLLGIPVDVANLVFFRITNTSSRSRILNDLKGKKLQSQYNLFWKSLVGFIRSLDQARNEIVHWHIVNQIDLSLPHEQASRLALKPPAGWTDPSSGSIDETNLNDFALKCDFASRSINMFSFLLEPHPLDPTWLDIFLRPIVYPPPDTHPLSPNYIAPQNPPQSSGV